MEVDLLDTIKVIGNRFCAWEPKFIALRYAVTIFDFFPTRVVRDTTITAAPSCQSTFYVASSVTTTAWVHASIFWKTMPLCFFPIAIQIWIPLVCIPTVCLGFVKTESPVWSHLRSCFEIAPDTCSKLICRNKVLHVTLGQIFLLRISYSNSQLLHWYECCLTWLPPSNLAPAWSLKQTGEFP